MDMTPPRHVNLDRAASFVSGIHGRTLPPEVIDAAKKCLADWLGVALGARDEAAARAVRATIAAWHAQGSAPVLFGAATTASAAALANGTLAHCLDFDDTHVGSVAHLSSPSWAAVLAVGSAQCCDERALLSSFVAAFEVGARFGGNSFGVAVNDTGWHSTGVFGTLAAAAGASAALRLDAEAVAHALGAAATQVSGLTGSFGTMSKPFHAGKAAFNGVLSAELAANGFVPAMTLIESGGPLARALVQDGAHAMQPVDFDAGWELLTNTFKPYACCLLTHATIDAARELAAQASGREVARITCSVNPLTLTLAAKPAPTTPLEGKFSTAFCAALALSGYPASQDDFSAPRIADPALRVLTGKVVLEGDASLGETAARMHIAFTDGSHADAAVALARGNPGNPMSWDDLRGKFMPLATPAVGAAPAAQLFDCVREFERPGSLATLWKLCGA
jgi:2-methylcitrate dehydratase PrpD